MRAKVDSLRANQQEWELMGARGRRDWLLNYQDWILDNARHIADVLQSETGKTRADAVVEAPAVADLIKYWSNHAERFLADTRAKPHSPLFAIKALHTNYRPYPVVGVITPWNFPFAAPAMDSIPALAAGAAVLVKPSEVTPLSAVELLRGWREIGAPHVFDLAIGWGETGEAVTDFVDYVQFTGSARTGRRIAARCGERLIPCSRSSAVRTRRWCLPMPTSSARSMASPGAGWSTPGRSARRWSASTSRRRCMTGL